MGIAPNPMVPEKGFPQYERRMASNMPGERGPERFQEGILTDTDVPRDFAVGIAQGNAGPDGRNQKVDTKYADETMAERAHVGSAAWITAPTVLNDFVEGAMVGDRVEYEMVGNPGTRQQRIDPTVVNW